MSAKSARSGGGTTRSAAAQDAWEVGSVRSARSGFQGGARSSAVGSLPRLGQLGQGQGPGSQWGDDAMSVASKSSRAPRGAAGQQDDAMSVASRSSRAPRGAGGASVTFPGLRETPRR